MKKFMMLAMVAVMLSACTEATEFGECIGLNSALEDPELIYEYNAFNIAVGIIFAETIVVPIVVLVDQLKCPVATTRPVEATLTVPRTSLNDAGLDDDFVVIIVGWTVLSLLSVAFVYWLVMKKFRLGFLKRK